MTTRTQRAVRLGVQAGAVMAGVALFRGVGLALERGLTVWERVASPIAVPLTTFVFFFGIVFVFAYAFPPNTDAFGKGLRFPGARWIVWPLLAAIAAVVVYIRIIKRQ